MKFFKIRAIDGIKASGIWVKDGERFMEAYPHGFSLNLEDISLYSFHENLQDKHKVQFVMKTNYEDDFNIIALEFVDEAKKEYERIKKELERLEL